MVEQTPVPISVDTNPHKTPEVPFSVDVDETSPEISSDTIEARTFKFNYGLGEVLQKNRDEIRDGLSKGQEIDMRTSAAAEVDNRKQKEMQRIVINTPASQLADIVNPVDFSYNTRPDIVLEQGYGKQAVGILDRTAIQKPDNILNDARAENPEAVADIFNKRSVLVSKREVLQTAMENIDDEIKSQSIAGWIWDQAKTMIPGYTDVQLRGALRSPEVGVFTGIGLGPNLEQQRSTLHNMSLEDFKDAVDRTVKDLKSGVAGGNPAIAKEWLEHMLKMSTDDVTLKTLQLPIESIGTGVGTATLKAAKRAITGTKSVLLRDVEKAVDDVVKETGNPGVSKSTLEAAAGDLESSAVTRTTSDVTATGANVPQATRRAIEELTGTLRVDEQNIIANPGRYGQDLVNRIKESSTTIRTNLIDVLKNVQKVERLPDILANETAVRVIVEGIKDTYRGLKNSILDVSKPYKEDVSNTYLVDMYLGKSDGTYFPNRQVAENYMAYHGLKDAEILEGKNTKYTSKEVAIAKINKDIEGAQKIITREEGRLKDADTKVATKAQEQIDIAKEYIADKKTALNDLKQTATVEQQGLGYYIKITKPINETDNVVRDYIAKTGNTRMPDGSIRSFVNAMLGKYRTPEEVLSPAERQNRLTATFAPSEYFRILQDNAKEINKLATGYRFGKKKRIWEEWQRGLENAQEIVDPLDPQRKGYFFKDPAEMETYWNLWFKRLPNQQEVEAYFEFKRGMEIDRIFRNIAEVRNQQRVGAETHSIVVTDPGNKILNSPEFSGVVRKTLPGADDNIVVIGGKSTEMRAVDLSRQSVEQKKEWQDLINAGKKTLIEIYNPELRPLSGFGDLGDSRVRYVLADSVTTRALDWNQIPRRGGGHVEYDHDWYIKQAKVTHDEVGNRFWYEGDTTIMAVQLERMGQQVADHLENIRRMLREKNETAARDYSNKNLHIDWDTIHKWFTGSTENGVFKPPRLSVNEPIQVVPRGRAIVDIDKTLENRYLGFKNGMKEGSLARQNRVEYAQERDAFDVLQINDEGTRNNPLYKVGQADKVDPITTMNRGLARIARSNFMDDYKTMAVEHWLQQAKNYLQATDSEIAHAPFYYYNEMKWKTGAPKEIVAALEANKYHIDQMIGQPSMLDGVLHSTAQKIADSIYGVAGPKALVIEPNHVLPLLKDPFKFIRSIVFNEKMGLFSIPQFIVQMGNYSNIYGIAGRRYATPGSLAAQFHFWSRVNSNPAIISHLDDLASKFHISGTSRWKPGEFKEAFEELRKTGFGNVGGEYAALDNPTSQKIVTDSFGTFLDWGTSPFRAGERNARYGAWYTAFKEWRDTNPIGRITDADRAKILQRADILNVNMSSASSSAIHKGFLSVPTQFYTYQIRLMELFFGSRLTGKERARMFATNAALYGIPMAGGLSGLPVADYLRTKAMDEGYVVGDNFFTSLLMEGLPSSLGAVITGKGDPQKGTYYDVGSRFGTKGLEFIGGLDRADKSLMDIMGGPAYSVLKGTIEQSDGFRAAMFALMKGDTETFPMVIEDLVDVFKEITTVQTWSRVYAAANAGRWISKKDAYLADASTAQALFSAVTGLKDQQITDIQTMTNSLKRQKEYEQEVENRFRQEFRRGVVSQNDNPQLAQRFFTRAMAWLNIGGYREDLIPNLVMKAIQDNESVLDKVNFDYYIRKAPDAQSAARLEAMRRLLELKDKRKF